MKKNQENVLSCVIFGERYQYHFEVKLLLWALLLYSFFFSLL